jgi:hypothetical protein
MCGESILLSRPPPNQKPTRNTIELLPVKDAGEVSASGEGYWFKRTEA